MINFGVIGYGYWGPNLVRNIADLGEAAVVSIAELRRDRQELARRRHPGVDIVNDACAVIGDPRIDAVVIATPVGTHFELAKRALQNGKHVLVEKPICASVADAESLVELAEAKRLVLLVDHTFAYTGAVRKVKQLIDAGEIGDVYYYDSVRINLGLFQKDVSVLWDLAVHDLAIMDFVLNRSPLAVSCTGCSHIPGQPGDIAYLTLFFADNLIAHLHVNWLSPVKLRRTLIGGSRKMIVYDDLEAYEKVRLHDKGLVIESDNEQLNQLLLRGYRSGDVWAPQVDVTEALKTEMIHFINCIHGRERPLTDGHAGLRVLRILEAAAQSLQSRGLPIELGEKRGSFIRPEESVPKHLCGVAGGD